MDAPQLFKLEQYNGMPPKVEENTKIRTILEILLLHRVTKKTLPSVSIREFSSCLLYGIVRAQE
jgi:hypothetical protein